MATSLYIAFDPSRDISAFKTMRTWVNHDDSPFDMLTAHDLPSIWQPVAEKAFKQKLSELLDRAEAFVLLVGENTRNNFTTLAWEISAALERELPIIVMNLDGSWKVEERKCPGAILKMLSLHGCFDVRFLRYAVVMGMDYLKKNNGVLQVPQTLREPPFYRDSAEYLNRLDADALQFLEEQAASSSQTEESEGA